MAMLIDGFWRDRDRLTDAEGRLERPAAHFRSWLTADGAPGPSGEGGFEAEPSRYHLYIARACPWAHFRRDDYQSHRHVNPSAIVPAGPLLDFDAPDSRQLGAERP